MLGRCLLFLSSASIVDAKGEDIAGAVARSRCGVLQRLVACALANPRRAYFQVLTINPRDDINAGLVSPGIVAFRYPSFVFLNCHANFR